MSIRVDESRPSGQRDEEEYEVDTGPSCEGIHDPIRKTLCKVCNKPVLGELPFCQEHEPPVP